MSSLTDSTDRHDRTRRFVARLTNASRPVELRTSVSITSDGSLAAELLIDLASRFASHVDVLAPPAASRQARMLLAALDVPGDVRIARDLSLTVASGSTTIGLFARGWSGGASATDLASSERQSVTGSLAAACLGAAAAFQPLVPARPRPDYAFSTWTCHRQTSIRRTGPEQSPIDLGHLVVVGAGAVGSALLACLDRIGVRGRLDIVDPDRVDITNLNRYLTLTIRDVGRSKAELWARRLARHRGATVVPHECTYEEFRRRVRPPYQLVAISTDNAVSRQAVQRDLPRIVLNAATDAATVAVSAHRFDRSACLGCIYPVDQTDEARVRDIAATTGLAPTEVRRLLQTSAPLDEGVLGTLSARLGRPVDHLTTWAGHPLDEVWARSLCGRIRVPARNGSAEGSASFVSALAGALLAGEVVKAVTMPHRLLRSDFRMDVFAGPSRASHGRLARTADCAAACYDPSLRAHYRRLWSRR